MTTQKLTIVDTLTDFATDILVIHANIDDADRLEKEELRLKKQYATRILKRQTS